MGLEKSLHVAQEPGALPIIWILWHRRIGDYHQMLSLAQALEWPSITKKLVFRPPNISFVELRLLDLRKSDCLLRPWPDLIFCGEALCARAARQVRHLSGNKTRIVVLGRPWGSAAHYDLVLTTAQYRLPQAPNVVVLNLPLTGKVPRQDCLPDLGADALKRPVIVVLLGASSSPDRLDAAAATTMAADLERHAGRIGGTLVIVASPRTQSAVTQVFARRLPPPHRVESYRHGPDNSYWRWIGMADEIVVTSDSVSMVADALSAGKQVCVYALPQRRTLAWRMSEWLYDRATQHTGRSALSTSIAWLFETGLIEVSADRGRLFGRLAAQGRLSWFGAAPSAGCPDHEMQDLATAAAAVRRLCHMSGAMPK